MFNPDTLIYPHTHTSEHPPTKHSHRHRHTHTHTQLHTERLWRHTQIQSQTLSQSHSHTKIYMYTETLETHTDTQTHTHNFYPPSVLSVTIILLICRSISRSGFFYYSLHFGISWLVKSFEVLIRDFSMFIYFSLWWMSFRSSCSCSSFKSFSYEQSLETGFPHHSNLY